jgi:hypothetical protein
MLQHTDKDYLMKLGLFLWLHGRKFNDINDFFRMKGIHISDNALRVRLYRYKNSLTYEQLSEIVESSGIPLEVINTELILAKKGIYKQENT